MFDALFDRTLHGLGGSLGGSACWRRDLCIAGGAPIARRLFRSSVGGPGIARQADDPIARPIVSALAAQTHPFATFRMLHLPTS
jgi:hypothetical protein